MEGWHTRETRPGFDPVAVIWHHTATGPNVPNSNVRRLLRDGRSDLPGPLSQLGLERDGTFVVIAAGRCNHNGYGTFGNDAIGIEAYNDGLGEPWPAAQLHAYDVGTAALCRALAVSEANVLGHRESDPGRKIDPTGIDMDAARTRIARLLAPTAADEETDMLIIQAKDRPTRLLAPPTFVPVGATTVKSLAAAGVKTATLTGAEYDSMKAQIQRALDEDN